MEEVLSTSFENWSYEELRTEAETSTEQVMSAASFASYIGNKLSFSDMAGQSPHTSSTPKLTAVWRPKSVPFEVSTPNPTNSTFKEDGSLLRMLRTKSMPTLLQGEKSQLKLLKAMSPSPPTSPRSDRSFIINRSFSPITPLTSSIVNPRLDREMSEMSESSVSLEAPPPTPQKSPPVHRRLERSVSDGQMLAARRRRKLKDVREEFPNGTLPSVRVLRNKFDGKSSEEDQERVVTSTDVRIRTRTKSSSESSSSESESSENEVRQIPKKVSRQNSLRKWDPEVANQQHQVKRQVVDLPSKSIKNILLQFENPSITVSESCLIRKDAHKPSQEESPISPTPSMQIIEMGTRHTEPRRSTQREPVIARPRAKSEPASNRQRRDIPVTPVSVKELKMQFEASTGATETLPSRIVYKKHAKEVEEELKLVAAVVDSPYAKYEKNTLLQATEDITTMSKAKSETIIIPSTSATLVSKLTKQFEVSSAQSVTQTDSNDFVDHVTHQEIIRTPSREHIQWEEKREDYTHLSSSSSVRILLRKFETPHAEERSEDLTDNMILKAQQTENDLSSSKISRHQHIFLKSSSADSEIQNLKAKFESDAVFLKSSSENSDASEDENRWEYQRIRGNSPTLSRKTMRRKENSESSSSSSSSSDEDSPKKAAKSDNNNLSFVKSKETDEKIEQYWLAKKQEREKYIGTNKTEKENIHSKITRKKHDEELKENQIKDKKIEIQITEEQKERAELVEEKKIKYITEKVETVLPMRDMTERGENVQKRTDECLTKERAEKERNEKANHLQVCPGKIEKTREERGTKKEIEKHKMEKEQAENERMKKEQEEKKRVEKEREMREQAEKERVAREQAGKAQAEKERAEKERVLREQVVKERAEKERVEKEQAEKERVEKEQAEKERAEKEQGEKERVLREQAEKERAEKERAEKERAEKERAEKERAEKERAEKERAKKERAEKELAKKEQEDKERAEKERVEKERIEKEREEKKQIEKEQMEKLQAAKEQAEKERSHDTEKKRNERERMQKEWEKSDKETLVNIESQIQNENGKVEIVIVKEEEKEESKSHSITGTTDKKEDKHNEEQPVEPKVGILITKFTSAQADDSSNTFKPLDDFASDNVASNKVGRLIDRFAVNRYSESDATEENRPAPLIDSNRRLSDVSSLIGKFAKINDSRRRSSSSSSSSSSSDEGDTKSDSKASSSSKKNEADPIPKISTKNIPGTVRTLNPDELRFFGGGNLNLGETFTRTRSLMVKKSKRDPIHPRGGSLRLKKTPVSALQDSESQGKSTKLPDNCRQLRPDEMQFFFQGSHNFYKAKSKSKSKEKSCVDNAIKEDQEGQKSNDTHAKSQQFFREDRQSDPGKEKPSGSSGDKLDKPSDSSDSDSDESLLRDDEDSFEISVCYSEDHLSDSESDSSGANKYGHYSSSEIDEELETQIHQRSPKITYSTNLMAPVECDNSEILSFTGDKINEKGNKSTLKIYDKEENADIPIMKENDISNIVGVSNVSATLPSSREERCIDTSESKEQCVISNICHTEQKENTRINHDAPIASPGTSEQNIHLDLNANNTNILKDETPGKFEEGRDTSTVFDIHHTNEDNDCGKMEIVETLQQVCDKTSVTMSEALEVNNEHIGDITVKLSVHVTESESVTKLEESKTHREEEKEVRMKGNDSSESDSDSDLGLLDNAMIAIEDEQEQEQEIAKNLSLPPLLLELHEQKEGFTEEVNVEVREQEIIETHSTTPLLLDFREQKENFTVETGVEKTQVQNHLTSLVGVADMEPVVTVGEETDLQQNGDDKWTTPGIVSEDTTDYTQEEVFVEDDAEGVEEIRGFNEKTRTNGDEVSYGEGRELLTEREFIQFCILVSIVSIVMYFLSVYFEEWLD